MVKEVKAYECRCEKCGKVFLRLKPPERCPCSEEYDNMSLWETVKALWSTAGQGVWVRVGFWFMQTGGQQMNSSHIKSADYDENYRTLDVGFHNGRKYRYSGVDREIYERLMSAPSHGKFFRDNIRDRFQCKEL